MRSHVHNAGGRICANKSRLAGLRNRRRKDEIAKERENGAVKLASFSLLAFIAEQQPSLSALYNGPVPAQHVADEGPKDVVIGDAVSRDGLPG